MSCTIAFYLWANPNQDLGSYDGPEINSHSVLATMNNKAHGANHSVNFSGPTIQCPKPIIFYNLVRNRLRVKSGCKASVLSLTAKDRFWGKFAYFVYFVLLILTTQ